MFSSCRPLLLPLVPPPSQLSAQLTYPSSWPLHCRHGVFFPFLFPPPLQPANKSLALSLGFFSLRCSLTLSVTNTLTLSFSFVSHSSLSRVSPPPLPHSSFASPPPSQSALLLGQCKSAGSVRLLLPQQAGLKRSAWELTLSPLSLPLALSLSPSPVSSQGDGGAALLAVEEVRGSPGSSHSAAVCCFTVVRLHPSLPHSLCVCVCVRVAFLSPPLSLIPLFACLS